jgi:hypothetical protein
VCSINQSVYISEATEVAVSKVKRSGKGTRKWQYLQIVISNGKVSEEVAIHVSSAHAEMPVLNLVVEMDTLDLAAEPETSTWSYSPKPRR